VAEVPALHLLPCSAADGHLRNARAHSSGRLWALLTDGEVCDKCNDLFGRTLDLELARNTIDGFARYQVGIKTGHFDPPTRNGYLRFLLADGPYAGVRASQRWIDGRLVASPMPAVGLGETVAGPFTWYEGIDAVPKAADVRALLPAGSGVFRIEKYPDVQPVLDRLRQLGFGIQGEAVQGEPIFKDRERIEVVCRVGENFGRALAKIAMNYIAAQFGPEMARRPGFSAARKFVHHNAKFPGGPMWGGVASEGHFIQTPHDRCHVVGAATMSGQVVAEIGFAGAPMRWQVALTTDAPGIAAILRDGHKVPLVGAGAHFYNLDTMTVDELGVRAWHLPGRKIEHLEEGDLGQRPRRPR
jgi:hypothetical protein